MATRVALAGALGRMGRLAALHLRAAPDLELVCGIVRVLPPEDAIPSELAGIALFDEAGSALAATRPEVVVDLSVYPASLEIARAAVGSGVAAVIGSTGWTEEDETSFAALCEARGVPVALVPNFALGAVLAMKFAEEAARYFPTVEIVELHHDGKRDAPSGTARLTARRIERARRGGGAVPVHSVRLRGLVAHQEVLFGGEGELLTIRHDSLSRESFMAGILLAVRRIRTHEGLVVGLEALLERAS